MIDAERTVYLYLDAHPDVDARVVNRTPANTGSAWITLQQLDARAIGDHRSDHAVDYLIQFSIYAGGADELWPLALATREALREMPGVHGDAVITGVRFAGMPRIPDVDLNRERVVLTANVYAHPA